jgi:hypothetical protein
MKNKDMEIFNGISKHGFYKIKYILSQFKNNYDNYRWYYYQFTNHIIPFFYRVKNNGIHIMEQDWDNLIILDACRFESFEKAISCFNSKGDLNKIISRGCTTVEFIKENFSHTKFLDTIYVTANPYLTLMVRKNFYKIVNLWRDGWDEELNTVHPEEVTKRAIEIHKMYPEKRLIIHYMQPHSPYIGSYRMDGDTLQVALKNGKDEAMKAYTSNLMLVLAYVDKLVKELNGKTVVTSDHGEAFGERIFNIIPIYGHPKLRMPILVEVPYFIVRNETDEKSRDS